MTASRPYYIAIVITLALTPVTAASHGGGLDERGCHQSTATGDYHCHQGPLAGRSFDSEAAAREANSDGDDARRPTTSAARERGYDRDAYGDWRDADGDCQNTRDEVLIAHARSYELGPRGCDVVDGVLTGPYTGKRLTDPSNTHIDHVIPLALAHYSGAADWPRAKKRRFANDPANLLPAHGPTNMAKGAQGPSEWLPDHNRCAYIARWTDVKAQYGLTMDPAEQRAIARVRSQC